MHFAASQRSTLGVEWELALVDPTTRELVGLAPELIRHASDERITGEFFTNTIELVSGVHTSTDAAIDEMRNVLAIAQRAASAVGVSLIGAGTHPRSPWRAQVVSDSPRYHRVIDQARDWGRRQMIFGVHTHVGVEDAAKVMPIIRAIMANQAAILALSASSPFWHGEDSGLVSQRTMLFQQLPTAGPPPDVATWAEYERVVGDLERVGAVQNATELRWDARPSCALGTVETRIADGATTLDELAAVTALTHCLVEEASRTLDAGRTPAHLAPWLVRENKWRATRDGLEATIVTSADGASAEARVVLRDAVDRLAPIADALGATASLTAVDRVVTAGGGASRQRAAHAAGGVDAIVDDLVASLLP